MIYILCIVNVVVVVVAIFIAKPLYSHFQYKTKKNKKTTTKIRRQVSAKL